MTWASARCKAQDLRAAIRGHATQPNANRPPRTEAPFGGPPTPQHAASGCLVGCAHHFPRLGSSPLSASHLDLPRRIAHHRGGFTGPRTSTQSHPALWWGDSPPTRGSATHLIAHHCGFAPRFAHHRGPFGAPQPTTEPAFSGGLIAHHLRTATLRTSPLLTPQAPGNRGILMTPTDLLSLRYRVPDSTLLDWLDLEQLLPERPCHIETDVLRRHWRCTQPSVSRRMGRLWEAGLLDYRSGGGLYRIRRLGPM